MTVKELREYLSKWPDETLIYYRDATYGGPDVELEQTDVEPHKDRETDLVVLLIH